MTIYGPSFARYFDDFATSWVRDMTVWLAEWLESRVARQKILLDLCCGGGITAAHFASRGWQVTGVDHSDGMLEVARRRFRSEGLTSVDLVCAKAESFKLSTQAAATTCLDGALNHLADIDALGAVFNQAAAATSRGGWFVFDLYEEFHLKHWNCVSITDRDGTVMIKRGVWDPTGRHGMLRISGCHGGPDHIEWVEQVLESWSFRAAEVTAQLHRAGWEPVDIEVPPELRKCHSGTCSFDARPCRTVFAAIRRDHHP